VTKDVRTIPLQVGSSRGSRHEVLDDFFGHWFAVVLIHDARAPAVATRVSLVLYREYFRADPGLSTSMAPIGQLHPLLVLFPIALVSIAAVAEVISTFSGEWRWRTVAVTNVRAGALFGPVDDHRRLAAGA
jgi:hypothetical protein